MGIVNMLTLFKTVKLLYKVGSSVLNIMDIPTLVTVGNNVFLFMLISS